MTSFARALAIALLSMAVANMSQITAASADTPWQKAHPRREEVNNRIAHQNHRIHQEVEGDCHDAGSIRPHSEPAAYPR